MEDKPIFDRCFRQRRYDNSECTFTNLYMWRKAYKIEWCKTDGFLCVKACWNGETFAFAPFGEHTADLGQVMEKLTTYFARIVQPLLIKGATCEVIKTLQILKPGHFTYREDRDNDDYVYLTQDLINLKGRKYSGKKNHVNAFMKRYPVHQYLPISEELVPNCINTALDWYRKREPLEAMLVYEKDAIIEALHYFTELELTGGAILVDGEVKAFAFGEALNEDTVVIHIEKGSPEIRGLYQVINQQFCNHAWSGYTYVNREEDMGIEGLRTAKQSYHPLRMIKKYDITLLSKG